MTRYARREQWETVIYGQCPLCSGLVRDRDGVPLIERCTRMPSGGALSASGTAAGRGSGSTAT